MSYSEASRLAEDAVETERFRTFRAFHYTGMVGIGKRISELTSSEHRHLHDEYKKFYSSKIEFN